MRRSGGDREAAPAAFGLALDAANHTLYITGCGGNTVEMLDVSACNAMHPSGCGPAPLTATVGSFPAFPAVDEATDTIYVPNINDGTVSVIDGADVQRIDGHRLRQYGDCQCRIPGN